MKLRSAPGEWYHASLRIALALLLNALACSPRAARAPSAQREAPSHTATPRAETTAPRADWLSQLASCALIGAEPFRSQHSYGSRRAQIRVNVEAEARYRALVTGTQFEPGTLIVETLLADAGGAPEFLVLERRGDGWHMGAFDGQGRPRPFDEALCHGCHAGAAAAPVFGPPRAVPSRESKR